MKEIFDLAIIWLFFSLALIVQSVCVLTSHHDYFSVEDDRNTVNKEVLAYVEQRQKKTLKTYVKKGLKAIKSFNKGRNILNRSRDEIIELCRDAIPADFYGLTVVTRSYGEPVVTEKVPFSLEDTQVGGSNLLELDMVTCPLMAYTDLATNEEKFFRYEYKFSKAKSRHSAFLFRQIVHTALTYPTRLIKGIDFDSLGRRAGSTKSHPKLGSETEESSVRSKLDGYQTIRHYKELYYKFMLLFNSFMICRLHRRHIIHTCRQIMRAENPEIELDVNKYKEQRCRKRPMHFEYLHPEKSRTYKEPYTVQCPPPIDPFNSNDESRPVTFLYLASNISYASVLVFSRLNERGKKLQPIMIIENVDVRQMKQDRRRTRFEPYEREQWRRDHSMILRFESNQTVKDKINSSHDYSTVRMPATLVGQKVEIQLPDQTWRIAPRFIDNRPQVEDFLIEFSRIKTNKLVYQRFQQTHYSIDFCHLSIFERKHLCDEALAGHESNLQPISVDPSSFDRPCFRQAITLKFREVDDLTTDKFSIWQCAESKDHPERKFFMGKSHFRDAVFLYKAPDYRQGSDEPLTTVYPDMLIYKINRFKLAQVQESARLEKKNKLQFRVSSDLTTHSVAAVQGR